VTRALARAAILAAIASASRTAFAEEPLPPAPPVAEEETPAAPPPEAAPNAPAPETAQPAVAVEAAPPPPPPPPPPPDAVIGGNAEPTTKASVEPPPAPYASRHGPFFQASLGGGALYGTNDVAADTRSFSGVAISWNLLLGGTIGRRWAVGAGVSREHVPSPSAHDEIVDGDEPNLDSVSFSLESLVAFVDYHPYADGFHALGQLGFGYLRADREFGRQSARDAKWVVSLGAGYDFELAGNLSVGGLAQFTYSRQEMYEGERRVDLDLIFPSLLVTVAYR
jgi:hypothetical protein